MAPDDYTENQAIISLLCGVTALIFTLGGQGTFLCTAGLLAGIAALATGLPVLRGAAANKKLAVTGTVTGTIALALQMLMYIGGAVAWLWNLVF